MRLLSISKPHRGFTLLEVLVTIGIFSIIFALGLGMSMDAFKGYAMRSERDMMVSLLTRARSNAMANIDHAPWGVCVLDNSYVFFKGDICAKEGSEVIVMSPSVEVQGFDSPVVFSQLSGTTTPISITLTQERRTSTIEVNYEGTILW